MALRVEVLAGIKLQLEARAALLEMEAANLREEAEYITMPEESAEMGRRAAVWNEAEAAKVRGMIVCIEEELGRRKLTVKEMADVMRLLEDYSSAFEHAETNLLKNKDEFSPGFVKDLERMGQECREKKALADKLASRIWEILEYEEADT